MPKAIPNVGTKELVAAFKTWIMNATSLLVSMYNVMDNNAYTSLRHGWLNRVFELAGMLCQPRLEPIPRKRKATVAAQAPAP
jgi:hypothetical protein